MEYLGIVYAEVRKAVCKSINRELCTQGVCQLQNHLHTDVITRRMIHRTASTSVDISGPRAILLRSIIDMRIQIRSIEVVCRLPSTLHLLKTPQTMAYLNSR